MAKPQPVVVASVPVDALLFTDFTPGQLPRVTTFKRSVRGQSPARKNQMRYLIAKTRTYPLEYTVTGGPDNSVVTFTGPEAETLANEYAAFKQPSQ